MSDQTKLMPHIPRLQQTPDTTFNYTIVSYPTCTRERPATANVSFVHNVPKHESDYLQKTYGGLGVAELLAPKMKALQMFRQSLMNTALLEYIERQNATNLRRQQMEQLGMDVDPMTGEPLIPLTVPLRTMRQIDWPGDAVRAEMMTRENRTAEGVSFIDVNMSRQNPLGWPTNDPDSGGQYEFGEHYLQSPQPMRFVRFRQNEPHPSSLRWRASCG